MIWFTNLPTSRKLRISSKGRSAEGKSNPEVLVGDRVRRRTDWDDLEDFDFLDALPLRVLGLEDLPVLVVVVPVIDDGGEEDEDEDDEGEDDRREVVDVTVVMAVIRKDGPREKKKEEKRRSELVSNYGEKIEPGG